MRDARPRWPAVFLSLGALAAVAIAPVLALGRPQQAGFPAPAKSVHEKLAPAAPRAAEGKWPTFKSKTYGYTVQYPPSWHLLTQGISELDLVDYVPAPNDLGILFHPAGHPDGSPGEIADEAELGVNVHPEGVETVDEWMIQDLPDEPIQKDEKISVARPVAGGCLALRRIDGTTGVNGHRFLDSYYYCTTKAGLYQVLLTYRPGNPHQADLEGLALKMILSLRIP